MEMMKRIVILATIFLLCGVASAQQPTTGKVISITDGTAYLDHLRSGISGDLSPWGIWIDPPLRVKSWCGSQHWLGHPEPDGSITYTFIGTWTPKQKTRFVARCDAYNRGVVSKFITHGLTKKYAHALQKPDDKTQQPKPKTDPIGDAIKAETDATTAFNAAKANLEAARSNTQAVLFREMAEAGVKPSECASVDAQGNSNPFACISRDAKTGAWSFSPKQAASKPDTAKTDKPKP